jgi:hypothetical protein
MAPSHQVSIPGSRIHSTRGAAARPISRAFIGSLGCVVSRQSSSGKFDGMLQLASFSRKWWATCGMACFWHLKRQVLHEAQVEAPHLPCVSSSPCSFAPR